MLEFLLDPNTIIAFLTLAALEIVLGIDNIIFISVLANRLPAEMRDQVRRFGLMFALVTRILLLLSLSWVMGLTEPIFNAFNQEISGRDLILLGGGLFLLWKASKEIYLEVEAEEEEPIVQEDMQKAANKAKGKVFWGAVVQIGILDIVFSLDSVITAVGLVDEISIMVSAVLVSVAVMLFAAKSIGDFVHRHPSIKVLALSFLTVVGMVLIAESMDIHIPKGYVYFAMAFSLFVEFLNIRARTKKSNLGS
ncbi:TerC family protein [Polynucleobacter sp. 30F-ANTBAC]|uniref:TerC family protein n=1 Tax=Polynucleobacter sp. 30F-ANTBAC TaxID=2689095 RepID=UPI001C0BB64A|nr:TerC family protein [Polynucleobacter sp. 30F-ANTBAC]MBU3599052.1 TerC family protein [Polynucleobacter sp. 30F-ANTBAC]